MKTFLICESSEHAEIVDGVCAAKIRDEQGAKCAEWSGVYQTENGYGVIWGSPLSEMFGDPPSVDNPDGDPEVVLEEEVFTEVFEDGVMVDRTSNWSKMPPPKPEPSEFA